MATQSSLVEFLTSFLDDGAILQGGDVSGRTAGGLHTEENIQAKVILRPKQLMSCPKFCQLAMNQINR